MICDAKSSLCARGHDADDVLAAVPYEKARMRSTGQGTGSSGNFAAALLASLTADASHNARTGQLNPKSWRTAAAPGSATTPDTRTHHFTLVIGFTLG